jgi:hypothetical protein
MFYHLITIKILIVKNFLNKTDNKTLDTETYNYTYS